MVTASPKILGLIAVTVLLTLLHCLQLAHCQRLGSGQNCNGQKYDLCENGTVCSYSGHEYSNHCMVDLGVSCHDKNIVSPFLAEERCRPGLKCDTICLISYEGNCDENATRNNQLNTNCREIATCKSACNLRLTENCKGNEDRCRRYAVCNVLSTCSLKVGRFCSHRRDWCGPGAECNERKCRCISGIAEEKNSTCVPERGIVKGRCLEGNRCTDVHATCNNATDTCECRPGLMVTSPTFACKLEVGQSCAGAQKDLCRPGAKCDVDNICKLIPGELCDNDLKNMCLTGHQCLYGWCGVDMYNDCKNHPGYCDKKHGLICDKVINTCKKKLGSSFCSYDAECPSGAQCVGNSCVCLHSGQSFAPDDRVCGLPKGKVGSQCENVSDASATGCHDPHAWCNKTSGLCECSTYYRPNYEHATCERKGRSCIMKGDGTLTPFFTGAIPVRLPCRAKLANFVCSGAQIEVYASKTYYTRIQNTYVDGVMVNVTTTDDHGKTSFQAYEVTNIPIIRGMGNPNSKTWKKVYINNTYVDDLINLSINSTTGLAELTRGLFHVAYQPPLFGTSHPLESWGHLKIICGDLDFEAKEQYPAVLCGSNTNTRYDALNFYNKLHLEMKEQFPNYYGYVPDEAFRRMSDRAILQRQDVPQPDEYCREASQIVTDGCVGLAEKLYNCSHMYDAKNPKYLSYATCIQNDVPPMKMYIACLRVLCNKIPEGTLEDTRRTISILQTCRLAPFTSYAYPKRFTPSDLLDLLPKPSTK